MKISVTFEKAEILKLIIQELGRQGFKARDEGDIDFDGPLEIRLDIEAEPVPVVPVTPPPKELPPALRDALSQTFEWDEDALPPGHPGSAENPIDITQPKPVDMTDILNKSEKIGRTKKPTFRKPE